MNGKSGLFVADLGVVVLTRNQSFGVYAFAGGAHVSFFQHVEAG